MGPPHQAIRLFPSQRVRGASFEYLQTSVPQLDRKRQCSQAQKGGNLHHHRQNPDRKPLWAWNSSATEEKNRLLLIRSAPSTAALDWEVRDCGLWPGFAVCATSFIYSYFIWTRRTTASVKSTGSWRSAERYAPSMFLPPASFLWWKRILSVAGQGYYISPSFPKGTKRNHVLI